MRSSEKGVRQSTLRGVTSHPEGEPRRPPSADEAQAAAEPAAADFEPDFSPDPDEPRPLELWSAVGDVPPWGTVLLLLACGLAFALQAARGEVGDASALMAWGANLKGATGSDLAWRLLASTFLHGGIVHLLWNALSLLMFGSAVEALYARPSFWIVYAGGGAAASAASLAVRSMRDGGALLSVGASGAIFALAGTLLVAAIRLRRRLPLGRARALAGAMLFLVATSLAGSAEKHTTDHVAHGAGLLAGALLGLVVPLSARLDAELAAGSASAATPRGTGPLWTVAGTLAGLALAVAFGVSLARGLAGP